jgi:hypothetical protein
MSFKTANQKGTKMSISEQPSRRSPNGQPHARVEVCPCCGQAITTDQQLRKIQKWEDDRRREVDKKAKELHARERETIKAEAKAEVAEATKASQKEVIEAKRQAAEAKRQAQEAQKLLKTAQADAAKNAEAKTEAEVRKLKDQHHKQIEGLNTTIRNLHRDLEKKTAQERGDGAEIDLLRALKAAFPLDNISDKKGHGPDVTQIVIENGRVCGKIIFESKDAKRWDQGHVTKLRGDRVKAKADYAILSVLTFPRTAPDGAQTQLIEDIIVVRPTIAVEIVKMLRDTMIKFATSQITITERDRIQQKLYELLRSERGQEALRAVPAAIAALTTIDDAQDTSNSNYRTRREKAYKALEDAHRPFKAAVDEILTGE